MLDWLGNGGVIGESRRTAVAWVLHFVITLKNSDFRFMITHLSQWYLTLEDLSVSSLASPSSGFGISSNTGLLCMLRFHEDNGLI